MWALLNTTSSCNVGTHYQSCYKRAAKQRGWVSPWAQMCIHTVAGAPASQLARGKSATSLDYVGIIALYPQENEA